MKIVNEPIEIDGIKVIQDYDEIAKALERGEYVYHWEAGTSLTPLINNMEYCKIIPTTPTHVKRGDCVFCRIKDHDGNEHYTIHQVWEISDCGYDGRLWFKIGSTFGTIFGWSCKVLGKAYGTDIYQEEMTKEILDYFENNS